ncbi:hypothetical protein QYE76_056354 [Lolium multiflorum]|uniref:Retrotransposon gag domain-containing protein n=1 Tax=Lolium multiflorum TaxID=4521 RepID=A0AAD8T2D4_LOLMU|nr:hypothetical protein QYE76_056354 [Lolium multiflorum]
MDAEDWLMDTERKLNTVGCNDLEKVFTWDEFKRKFRESNVPESIVELKRREFESLEQKDKAITYVREFSKLSRYAVEEVNTEDKKKKRFLRGLSPQSSKDGIAVNPSKVAAVLEWEAPKTVKEIRGFLGMAGYYRRFIEGFSKIAGPMTKLLRKNTPFVWSEECEKSFQTLKEKLTTAPVLAPEVGKDYTVY